MNHNFSGGVTAVIQRTESLSINIRVRNIAEPAYLAIVLITIPDFLSFDRAMDVVNKIF